MQTRLQTYLLSGLQKDVLWPSISNLEISSPIKSLKLVIIFTITLALYLGTRHFYDIKRVECCCGVCFAYVTNNVILPLFFSTSQSGQMQCPVSSRWNRKPHLTCKDQPPKRVLKKDDVRGNSRMKGSEQFSGRRIQKVMARVSDEWEAFFFFFW